MLGFTCVILSIIGLVASEADPQLVYQQPSYIYPGGHPVYRMPGLHYGYPVNKPIASGPEMIYAIESNPVTLKEVQMKVNPYEGCGGGATTVKIKIYNNAGSICETKAIPYPVGAKIVWKSDDQLKSCAETKFDPIQSKMYYTIEPTDNNMYYCIDAVSVILNDQQLTNYIKKTDDKWRQGTSETFVLDKFRCPTEDDRYRILEKQCYFFNKIHRDYSDTEYFCKTAFGPNVVGKLWEPKNLRINNVVGAEARKIFGRQDPYPGQNYFWIGISNNGELIYQSSGETAAWEDDMPFNFKITDLIGSRWCLTYYIGRKKWDKHFCTWSRYQSHEDQYSVCEIDN